MATLPLGGARLADRFCLSECAFLNRTADPEDPNRLHGDTGAPSTLSLYRVTPWAPEFGARQKIGSEGSRLAESERGVWF